MAVGDKLEMIGEMKFTGNALPDSEFRLIPAHLVVVVGAAVVGDEMSILETLSTPTKWQSPFGLKLARLPASDRGQDSQEGNPDYNPCAHAA